MKTLEKEIANNEHSLLLDFTGNSSDETKGMGLKSDTAANNGHVNDTLADVMPDTFSHIQGCLSRALAGVSLDNMSQVFAVVNDSSVGSLISLEQSKKSNLKDELVAILHQQASWYHCSGRDGEMLLLQDLLQKLDQIPAKMLDNYDLIIVSLFC